MQPIENPRNLWKKAVVTEQVTPRSYHVQTENGTVYRRDRAHLSLQKQSDDFSDPVADPQSIPDCSPQITPEPCVSITHPQRPPSPIPISPMQDGKARVDSPAKTRVGRKIVKPKRFADE